MATDLIGALKQRIFNLVDSVQPASRYKALVIDENVQRIFDHVLDKHELLDRNISSIQRIDDRRKTEQYLECIYILKPTRYNVECMSSDYIRSPPRYSAAHIFFLPGLSSELALKVKNSSTGRYLRNLKVAYIDFWPVESQIFSLDDPHALEVFYGSQCLDLVERQANHVADQLVSLCTTLNEYPVIRFFNPPEPQSFKPKMLPYMVADKFQKALDIYVRDHPDFQPADETGRPRSVFLIVDRPIDLFAPLLHDFTFQSLAYDLLPIRDGIHFDYQIEKPTGVKEIVKGTISEKDPEWIGLRHRHMTEVTDQLTLKIEKLRKENPHFADQSTKASVTDLQDMVAALPGFMQTRDRFALIVQMATECMKILEDKSLIDVADIEQTCALSGISADGKKSKTVTDEFIDMLASNPKLSNADKVRLIIIYILYRGTGILDKDLEKLVHHAGLKSADEDVIKNYTLLCAPIIKESLDSKHRSLNPTHLHINSNQSLYNGNSSLNDGGKIKKSALYYNSFHSHSTEDVYSVSRFVPGLKNVTEKLIKGTLNTQLFQYTKDEPVEDEVDLTHSSLRNPRQRAAWAKTSNFQAAKQRAFVFVVGGLTQGEARAAYELNKQFPREVIFGGSSIITPVSFVRSLSRMNRPRDQLDLPQDERSKRPPAYLMESDREIQKHNQSSNAAAAPTNGATPLVHGSTMLATPSTAPLQKLSKDKEKDKKKSKFKLFK